MDIDKIAIDANVILYAYDNRDVHKQGRAIEILLKKPFVTQLVIFEFMKVLEENLKGRKGKSLNLPLNYLQN